MRLSDKEMAGGFIDGDRRPPPPLQLERRDKHDDQVVYSNDFFSNISTVDARLFKTPLDLWTPAPQLSSHVRSAGLPPGDRERRITLIRFGNVIVETLKQDELFGAAIRVGGEHANDRSSSIGP